MEHLDVGPQTLTNLVFKTAKALSLLGQFSSNQDIRHKFSTGIGLIFRNKLKILQASLYFQSIVRLYEYSRLQYGANGTVKYGLKAING